MRPIRDYSIKNKLRGIIILVSSVAVLTACAIFMAYEQSLYRKGMAQDLSSLTEIVADRTGAAIVFDDQAAAQETLSALHAKESIISACLYTDNGKVFTCYFRGNSKTGDTPSEPGETGHRFLKDSLIIFRPIILDNERIGTVFIKSDLFELDHILKQNTLIVAAVMGITLLLAFFLSSWLQKLISGPVLSLVQSAKTVSEKKDYSIRVKKQGEDEHGRLVDTFNEMLAQIQTRDEALIQHRERLEEEVAARTAELSTANEVCSFAKEEAEEATKAKSDFLSIMSHEIRTPLNAILGMGELLEETSLTPDQKEYVQLSGSAGSTLLALINDILDFSKIEAGHIDLESINFNVRETVEKNCEIMAARAHKKNLEIAFHISPETPIFVMGDQARLNQILINLIGNAIKFTDTGEVVVKVQKAPEPSGEGQGLELLFSVIDTGIGIPGNKAETIFETFSQADSSTTRKYGGTGLGLSICKRLVELMQGRIWVEGEFGKGSAFHFTVRLLPGIAEENLPPSASEVNLAGKKVLIVDDTPVNRLILREFLKGWGALVVEAEDGENALKEIIRAKDANDSFDFILLDCKMPGMDGFEVAQRIKEIPGLTGLSIMMVTSDNRSGDIAKCKKYGISRYLLKPIKRSSLLKAILEVMARPKDGVVEKVVKEVAFSIDLQPMNILLVEDTVDNQFLFRAFLKSIPWNLDIAENGAIGVDKFKTGKYDLVLMDMQMPVMDGYTATREIRRWEKEMGVKDTPIIALTAYALAEELRKSIEAGCNGHITKPVKKAKLIESIQKHFNASKKADGSGTETKFVVHVSPEIKHLLPSFMGGLQENLHALNQALVNQDNKTIEIIGHKMKGAGEVCGSQFHSISDIGADIEAAAIEKNQEAMRQKIDELSNYLERIETV
jgi:signal transduction histidine kinase/DNA-binding response OmpR family regulator